MVNCQPDDEQNEDDKAENQSRSQIVAALLLAVGAVVEEIALGKEYFRGVLRR